jgi:hypothetical protein
VVVAKIPIERKQEGEYPEVHHGDFGNGSPHQVCERSSTKTEAGGGAGSVQNALDKVLTIACERGKDFGRMMYFVEGPPNSRAMAEQVGEIENHVGDQERD